ncbi:flagellar hook-length control protein FliK [Endozoicomonas sp. GU-1]|uniref:flagellar hook-length control protein FliK n=1 Tax=Endozoicomonas sp. GU-1 TaxID=3009078 RepID=UPI0022B4F96A|nr:flagellar hook-length control protein FliK [Endozoicomonas sp. GU-1]WBA82552.1 flagellar hook-length control protein FliK [Endozoicomonas sp. GU-1]WBA85483.1 flagellar hook-length control protein FliK [Endozoicomonas sp. GU-1]
MAAIQHLPATNLPVPAVPQHQAPSGDQHLLFHRIYQQMDASGNTNGLTDVLPAFPEQLMPRNGELEQPLEPYGGQPALSAGSFTPAIMHLGKASCSDLASSDIGRAFSTQISLQGADSVRAGAVSQYPVSPEVAELADGRNQGLRTVADISNQTMLPGNSSRQLSQAQLRGSGSEPLFIARTLFTGDSKTLNGIHGQGAALPNDAFSQTEQPQGIVTKAADPFLPEVHPLISQVKIREQAHFNLTPFSEAEPIHGNQVSHGGKLHVPASVEANTETLQQKAISHREVIFPQSLSPQRLGTELIQMLRKGETGLEIRLDPPELGRLSLSVSLDAESLSLQVTASSATTRDLLLNQSERLRQVLAEHSVDLSELSVDVHSGQGEQAGRHQAANMAASETLLQADWGRDNVEYLSGAQLFRSGGGRLLDHFV